MGLMEKLKGFRVVQGSRQSSDADLREQDGEAQFELSWVGPYRIIAPIGSGGMGTVYKAIDPVKDVTVAIKVLDRRFDLDRKRRRRDYIGREVMIASSLNHPNIIRMSKDIIVQEDNEGNLRRCIVMEFVDGYNLRHFIENRPLSVRQMMHICIKLGEALDFLHQKGIVHRDIKPANFLFSKDGRQIKICDFGLSKSTQNWWLRWVKESGGTKLYMSPEQLRKKNLDARSDIFSFGLTMFEFFTGKHPCNGLDMRQKVKQIISPSYPWPAPSSLNAEIPEKLDRVILKCMRRNIRERYQTCTELLLDLSRVFEASSRI